MTTEHEDAYIAWVTAKLNLFTLRHFTPDPHPWQVKRAEKALAAAYEGLVTSASKST